MNSVSYPPRNDQAWMGNTAETLYTHHVGGLDGVRCGYYLGPWVIIRCAAAWGGVTCPDCLKLKESWEPETVPTMGD